MGNKCKRFLVMLMLTLMLVSVFCMNAFAAEPQTTALECYTYGDVNGDDVIDQKDAIYLLYHAALGESLYPLDGRGGDMDGDGDIDKDDAIRLLFHTFPSFAEEYPLAVEGTIHGYFEPVWTWKVTDGEGAVMAATMTVKCACGEEYTQTEDVYADTKAANCTEEGYEKYSVTMSFNGADYEGTYEKVIPATGHNVAPSCAGAVTCANGCGYEVAATAHTWEKKSEKAATCGAAGEIVYQCSVCKNVEKTEVIPATGAHTYGDEIVQAVEGKACTFEKIKTCECGHTITSGAYEEHSYTDKVQVNAHATCTATGEKVYTCDNCPSTKTEEIAVNPDAHTWQTEDDTHYTCACGAEKVVERVENNKDISKDNLDKKELALAEGTALSLDGDTVNNLPAEQVQISVENVADKLDLSEEQKEAIGNNPVYDFNMTYQDENGETKPVSDFSGKVTVTLPYELGEGEDPESIAVWYINGDGETESIYATYANGYITFTTNHFSYYTVTRLSPAERCALYGHKYGIVPLEVKATCTDGGYTYQVCQRCAYVDVLTTTDALGHDYQDNSVAATCTAPGKFSQKCSHCKDLIEYDIPALGHSYQVESTAASCEAAGKNVYTCKNCNHSYEEVLPKLEHDTQEEVKAATCSESGYTKLTCKNCAFEQTLEAYPAKGHRFNTDAENVVWDPKWEDDVLVEETVEIFCAEDDCDYSKILTAVITEEDKTDCDGGEIYYHAKAVYNGHYFEHDPYKVQVEGEGHKNADVWIQEAGKHYHKCSVCKEIYGSGSHNWDEGTVTKKATCKTEGQMLYKCTVCGYEKTAKISATTEHNFKNGTCVDCGFTANNCSHLPSKYVTVDLAEYGACEGGYVQFRYCECGEVSELCDWGWTCNMAGVPFAGKDDTCDIAISGQRRTCTDCGLVVDSYNGDGCTVEPCAEVWVEKTIIRMGDEKIAERYFVGTYSEHTTWRTDLKTEIVDLTKYGLCSEKFEKIYCPCGEFVRYENLESCEWVFDAEHSDEDVEVYRCNSCDAEHRTSMSLREDVENCVLLCEVTHDYYVNGKKVTSIDYSYIEMSNHSTKVADFVMMGENCEDGVIIKSVCTVCGWESVNEWGFHVPVNYTDLDLSGYDICYDTAATATCLCDLKMRTGYIDGENWCNWELEYTSEDGLTERFVCTKCGAQHEIVETNYAKDENCYFKQTWKYKFTDKNGKHIFTYYDDYANREHNYIETVNLKGQSCVDGVERIYTCKDCGYSYTTNYSSHMMNVVERLDVSDMGMCSDALLVYACACEENVGTGYEGSGCNWSWIDHADGISYSECQSCGAKQEIHRKQTEQIDSCHERIVSEYVYINNGITKSFTIGRVESLHSIIAETTLLPGATDCSGGYMVKESCIACDYETEYGPQYGHTSYAYKRENLSNGQLCGDLYRVYFRCACGQESSEEIQWPGESCDMEWVYNEEFDRYGDKCMKCGAFCMYTDEKETFIEGTCQVKREVIYTYYRDGKELFSYFDSWTYDGNHQWAYEFFMNEGATQCSDGYRYVRTCTRCGETDGSDVRYWDCSDTYTISREFVYDGEGICSPVYTVTYTCACGKNSGTGWHYDCWFRGREDKESGRYIYKCDGCGAEQTETCVDTVLGENCIVEETRFVTVMLNGKELYTTTVKNNREYHCWEYDFVLQGQTCGEGYTYTRTCKKCGTVETSVGMNYGCEWLDMDVVQVYTGEGACGSFYYGTQGCACGNLESTYYESNCNFEESLWSDELGAYVQTCQDCGLVRYYESTTAEPDENCNAVQSRTVYLMRDGVVIGSATLHCMEKEHTWKREFNLLGSYCDDGYTVTNVCKKCGERGEESDTHYGCSTYSEAEKVVIHNGEGICGPVTLENYSCACGAYRGAWIRYDCDGMSGYWSEEHDSYLYTCDDCGMKYTDVENVLYKDDRCVLWINETVTVFVGDETFAHSFYRNEKAHSYVYQLKLVDGATSCEDGYYINRVCADCGHSEYDTENIYTGHNYYTVERYDLDDYGFCGGSLRVDSCACGMNVYVNEESPCNYEYLGYVQDGSGLWYYHCAGCNTYLYRDSEGNFNREECRNEGHELYRYVRNGEVVLEVEQSTSSIDHTFVATELSLTGEYGSTGTCQDGYHVERTCYYCGKQTVEEGYGCGTYTVEYIDLAEYGSSCGGSISIHRCACGRYSGYDYDHTITWRSEWSEKDENGIEHYYQKAECSDGCGLEFMTSHYMVLNEGSCEGIEYWTITVTLGDSLNETLEYQGYVTSHDWSDSIYELSEGSVTCMDGLIGREVCLRGCGAENTWGTYPGGHYYMNVQESVDLTEYGSECGGTMNHFVCPCGAADRWDFGDDLKCDLDQKSTELTWLEDVVDREFPGGKLIVDEYQKTTMGWNHTYSDAWIFTCAVSDPTPCGMKIRMGEYWVKQGCEVKEYQTWQLGYDAENNTWLYEVTMEIGNQHALHDYVYTDETITVDTNTWIDTEKAYCYDCDSYWQDFWTYSEYEQIKTEREAVNTLDNGEYKRVHELYEYGVEVAYENGSNRYETLEYVERVYADGSAYWYKYEYTYDFEEACMRSSVYTNSNGDRQEYVDTCHLNDWNTEDLEAPTCTQFGSWKGWYSCPVCGTNDIEHFFDRDPIGHYWYWDYMLNTYVCSVCDLQSAVGASGVVVMEDMTEEKGNGIDYVIGYWNRDNVDFTVELSVIFNDRDEDHEDGNQFMLTGVDIINRSKEDDGYVGKSFNKADAIEKATEKCLEQGYEGSFSIRINFVPVNDEYDLDYAITFDPIGAAA